MSVTEEDRQRTVRYAQSLLKSADTNTTSERIEQGITEIRSLMSEVLDKGAAGRLSPVLARAYQRLLDQGVAEIIATAVIQSVQVDQSISDEALTHHLTQELLRRLPHTVAPPRRDASAPTIIALVGPTGVGKTTTIAKIAAKYRMQQERHVVLVTADTYRVAAVDQLRQYADLFDAQLEIAGTVIQMKETMASLQDADLVLIDTAGRSAADGDRIQETAVILAAAQPTEIHLVLSAATSLTATRRAAKSFAVTKYDRVIVTKLDEAATFGQIMSTLCMLGKPLSWFTNGQDIASHLEMARASTLVDLLFSTESGLGSDR